MASRLDTARLILEPFDTMDAASYAELVSERGPGGRGFGTTVDQARHNIARLAREAQDTGIGLMAVRRRAERDPIGYCGLIAGRASVAEPEIAYELFRRVHGRGYATEAVVAVIGAAAATGRRRLWSTVDPGNAPSLRVLEKAGFHRHHTQPDRTAGEIVYLVRDLRGE